MMSLGQGGWVTVDMGATVVDGPGDDVRVYQATSNEEITVYASSSRPGTVHPARPARAVRHPLDRHLLEPLPPSTSPERRPRGSALPASRGRRDLPVPVRRHGVRRRRPRRGPGPELPVKKTALLAAKLAVSAGPADLPAREHRPRRALSPRCARRHRPAGGGGRALHAIVVLSTWRWRVLLRAQGYEAPLRHLSASYLVANFFNNFLPSNIGGDVVRVRDSSRLTGSTTTSVAIVAIDRILGFGALYVLALLAYVRSAGPRPARTCGARHPRSCCSRDRLRGARLRLLPSRHRAPDPGRVGPRRDRPGCASASRSCRPRCTSTAGRSARCGWRSRPASRCSRSSSSTTSTWRSRCASRCLSPRRSSSCPCASWCRRCRSRSTAGASARACSSCTSSSSGCRATARSAFSLVGAGLMVLLSLSGAVVWTSRQRPGAAGAGRMRTSVLHVCDKFGVAGLEHPRRVAPLLLVVPPLRPRAASTSSLVGLKTRGARLAPARSTRASRSITWTADASTRASSATWWRWRARATRASSTCTATRRPTSAGWRRAGAGRRARAARALRRPAHARVPGARRPPARAA